MTHELSIDPASGALRVAGLAAPVVAGQAKAEIAQLLAPFAKGDRDHRNGYAWLSFTGLAFGGYPCDLALCFFEDRLVELSWNVTLPDAPEENGWPSRQAIDDELWFVRQVLEAQLGRSLDKTAFDWGRVWSAFDPKGLIAANGLRYRQSPQYR